MRSLVPRRLSGSWVVACLVVLVAVVVFTALFAACPPVAAATAVADDGWESSEARKVAVFESVVIPAGEAWDTVVVIGGNVEVYGTIVEVLVVVGGDLIVGSEAVIGASGRYETSLVSVFGDVTVHEGGVIRGRTVDVGGSIGDAARAVFVDPVVRTWRPHSLILWGWSSVMLLVAGLIASAVAPRQLSAVRDRARRHLFSSLGWGLLGAIIFVPLITALLIVTVIGVLVAIPWVGVVLPALFLFGLAAVAAMIGGLFFGGRSSGRETLIPGTILGMVIICILRLIPIGGAVIVFFLSVVGFGATYVSIWLWLRERRARRREERRGAGPTDPGGPQVPSAPPYAPGAPPPGVPPYAPSAPTPAAPPYAPGAPTPGGAVPGTPPPYGAPSPDAAPDLRDPRDR